ncbi:MAG: hypothetical protein K0S20_785, partial [Patescibacteria group bacterium]|nr:hypothetical protein [Patescibacteria group bacterium]
MGLFSTLYLGIDLTPTAVRVVGISSAGKKTRFVGCKEVLFPASEEGSEFSVPTVPQVADAIVQAMKTAAPKPLHSGKAFISVPESKLLRKVLELPPMRTEEELRSAVQLELVQFLPDEMTESEFDCQTLGTLSDGVTQQVMAVAVARS